MARRNRVPESVSMETPKARKAEEQRRREIEDRRRIEDLPSVSARDPNRPMARRASLPEILTSKLPTGASRDAARMALHGLARTGNTILRAIDIPNRVFGNTRSLLQDIYERSEANLARDAYEDRSGVPQVGETAVHLASAGVLGKALPAVFGANVGADTYETAKYAGASEGEALAKGLGHGAVDTAIWTLGQGLASKYLPKAWQWLGREITGAGRGAASSVTSDAVLNSLGADISGEEMAKRAVHAAWMVPLLGMLKMGGKRREEAMSLLRKARPDLAGEKADKVIETIEAEFADPKSQKVALAWVARKGANLPDDIAQIRQALEVSSKVKGFDPMSKSPFEILSNPAYARYLPKPRPQDVKAFSNMKRYPMGVIGFDVSDDAAGRQATREMINAYMSPSSNPWCLATGKGAARLGELGPDSEKYWKMHSAVPKQIFFQDMDGDGDLALIAFRATSPGGEGRQEYYDTSDAGYSGIPIRVKVPGDPMGRYRKMVFRPENSDLYLKSEQDIQEAIERGDLPADQYNAAMHALDSNLAHGLDYVRVERFAPSGSDVRGTFEDIAPGKVFKGDPFRDGRSQTWVQTREAREGASSVIEWHIQAELRRHNLPLNLDGLRELRRGWTQPGSSANSAMLDILDESIARTEQWSPPTAEKSWVLVEDKVRTTENGITKFRTTKYADPKPGEAPKPVEIEESELVSPEWMRSRGYDPESESDVRRMQQDLNIQAWGNGAEAAMSVVPTKRTYMQTKSGTPETVTYGPNGRDIVSVDFTKDGVPYREEFFHSGPDYADPSYVYHTIDLDEFPRSSVDIGINEPTGSRLTRNPDGTTPEVLNEVKWDDGLGGFVRTSGNRRWRMLNEETERLAREQDLYEAWMNDPASMAEGPPPDPAPAKIIVEDRQPDGTWAHVETYDDTEEIPFALKAGNTRRDVQVAAKGGDTRSDAKGGNTRTVHAENKGGKSRELSEEQRVARVNAGIAKHPGFSKGDIEDMRRSAAFIADPQNAIRGLLVEGTLKHDAERPVFYSKNGWEDGQEGFQGDRFSMAHTLDDGRVVVFPSIYADEDGTTRLHTGGDAFKHYEQTGEHFGIYDSMENAERASVWSHHAGNAGWLKRLEKQQDAKGGDTGPAEDESIPEPGGEGETPPSSPPAGGGPRIVINPSTFRNEKDALCVAFNEAFRLVMEEMGFNPVAEPTEAQRKFFSDTAYRDDELQLRRTILARICTFDTSVKDPTDEQLQEAVEFLTSVMEAGAPQNEWEQQAVMRLRDVIAKVAEKGRRTGTPTGPSQAPGTSPAGS